MSNPTGLQGIAFVSFASQHPEQLANLFHRFGFSMTHESRDGYNQYFNQGNIHLFLCKSPHSDAVSFARNHGPSIPAMGWYFSDPLAAYNMALSRGAKAAERSDWVSPDRHPIPAIVGIGGSLIYFLKHQTFAQTLIELGFQQATKPEYSRSLGFDAIDHLTNNVAKGEMSLWARFYKEIFGFEEVRYFDIRGVKTGLTSYALRSPCGSFCIPINEGTEERSQINEYLREYNGAGIQHLAFTTNDIIQSVEGLNLNQIETLDMDGDYYREAFQRVPKVTEDRAKIEKLNILVDGDEQGYLLQIFTKNIIGPIFIEIIQRKNHNSFGEGNFSALFRSIERDQEKRGVLR